MRVAPAAAHTAQARRALHVRPAGLALAGLPGRVVAGRRGAVEPLAAQAELVLAGVDAEAEALARGLAPHAAAALVEAVLAAAAQAAGRGAGAARPHGAARPPAPRAPRLVRPPLAVVPGHAALATDVVGAVGAGGGQQREVAPAAVDGARRLLVDVPRLAAVRQLAPPARRVRQTEEAVVVVRTLTVRVGL